MDEATDKKMCSCGMAMDAEGHQAMVDANPADHTPATDESAEAPAADDTAAM